MVVMQTQLHFKLQQWMVRCYHLTFELTVQDESGATSTDTASVTVKNVDNGGDNSGEDGVNTNSASGLNTRLSAGEGVEEGAEEQDLCKRIPQAPACRLTNNFILPETRITSVKDRNGTHLPVDGSSTPSTISDSITFTFEGEQLDEDKSGQVSFKCRLDRGAVFEPCTSPITYSGLATDRYKGTFVPHTFEVVAIDNSIKKGTIDKFGNPI